MRFGNSCLRRSLHACRPLALGLLAALALHAQGSAPRRPAIRAARAFDLRHQALDLRFDWGARRANGSTRLSIVMLRESDRIALDAGALTIQSVTLANGTPLTHRYDGGDGDDGLAITLDRTYAAGDSLTVVIAYQTGRANLPDPNSLGGSNGLGLRFLSPISTEPIRRRQVWSMNSAMSNRYWFPTVDAPDELRTTTIEATVPAPLMAIANGTLGATTVHADGTRTFRWEMPVPYAPPQTAIVVGEYTDIEQRHGSIPLHSLGYPDEADAVRASVTRLPDMMRYFESVTGASYPYPAYTQVFVQDMPWGIGSASLSTMTENMVDDAATHDDYFYLWDGLQAEGLAHQWFGGLITVRDWRDVWLSRAFAHHLDGLYTEHRNGRDEFLLWQQAGDFRTYFADWNSGLRRPVIPASDDSVALRVNDNYPYVRGALVLNMLRHELGDSLWLVAVRRYVAWAGGRAVTTDDLQRVVEEVSGRPMGWFFEQWITHAGHPLFAVSTQVDSVLHQVTVTVRQTQVRDSAAAYPQVAFFQGRLDIAIDTLVYPVRLEPAAVNSFTFPSAAAPRLVSVDVGAHWIKQLTFVKSLDALLYQVAHDRDVTGVRWAMGELARIGGLPGTSARERTRIISGLRAVAARPAYWRLKTTALTLMQGVLTAQAGRGPVRLDDSAMRLVQALILRDSSSWTRAAALGVLGLTRDDRQADRYIALLRDRSHVVSYAAATALGQSRSPKAFAALAALRTVPSWKGENVLSALIGLRELRDPRAVPIAVAALADSTSPRWTLAVSRWDTRLAAAEVLAALGRGATGYDIVQRRFTRSLSEHDVSDQFGNVQLMVTLADPRTRAALATLRERSRGDANALSAVQSYEELLTTALAAAPRPQRGRR